MSQFPAGTPVDPAVARRAQRLFMAVLAVIAALLVVRAWVGSDVGSGANTQVVHGFGMVYVEQQGATHVQVPASTWADAVAADPAQQKVAVSWPRTFGIWMAAFLTIAVLSFLWRDNPLYKLAESVVVGVSAGYVMATAVWSSLIDQVFGKLAPELTREYLSPGLAAGDRDWWALVPLALGMLLL